MTEPDRLELGKSLTPNLDNALSHPNTCGYGVFIDADREVRRLKDRLADRDALKKELARLLEALTPSGATKAAYMGEFRFSFVHGVDEDGNDVVINVQLPWTTIKDVMDAILKRAAVATLDVPDGAALERESTFDFRKLGETCNACHAPYDEPACGPLHALVAHERRTLRDDGAKPQRVMVVDVGTLLVGTGPNMRAVVLHVDRARGQVTLRRTVQNGDFTISLHNLEHGRTGWIVAPNDGGGGNHV